ncbi:MAG TPA: hypothetical protein VGJ21_13050, partial [Terracidiphilus sp.]
MLTPEAAVQHCLDAHNRACERDDARNDYTPESLRRCRFAWREAMPFLTNDPDAIDAFIACVTHGMILEIFTVAEGSKLLYAAQVAIGSRRARQQAARQEAKSSQQQQTPTPSPLESRTPPATPSPAQAPPPPTPSSDSRATPADAQPQAPPTPLPPRKQPATAPAARP